MNRRTSLYLYLRCCYCAKGGYKRRYRGKCWSYRRVDAGSTAGFPRADRMLSITNLLILYFTI